MINLNLMAIDDLDGSIISPANQQISLIPIIVLIIFICIVYFIQGKIIAIIFTLVILILKPILTFLYNLLFRFKIRDILFDIIVIESKDDAILFVPDSKEDYLKVKEYFLNNLNIDLDKNVKKKFLYFKLY